MHSDNKPVRKNPLWNLLSKLLSGWYALLLLSVICYLFLLAVMLFV